MQHHVVSNVVDWNRFQNQSTQRISGLFVVVFDRLDIRRDVDLSPLLYLWHRCKWLAFVRTVLLVLIRWVFHCDDPMMPLYVMIIFQTIIIIVQMELQKNTFNEWMWLKYHLLKTAHGRRHLQMALQWFLLCCGVLSGFAEPPNQEPILCVHELPPK